MKIIGHKMIRASAGSGKTTQLAWRYIALMAHGVPPGRIVALTFSRKAALEMFEKVANVLVGCCQSEDERRFVAERLDPAPPTPPDFPALLRALLDDLHRLRIGTLDSFTAGLTRSFPLELGVGPAFLTGDEEGVAAADVLDEAIAHLLDPARTGEEEQAAFLDSFRRLRFGQERGLHDRLLRHTAADLAVLRLHPNGEEWADPRRVWPSGNRALDPRLASTPSSDELKDAFLSVPFPDKLVDSLLRLAEITPRYHPHLHWDEVKEWVKRLLKGLSGGAASIAYNRKEYELPPEAAAAFRAVLDKVRHEEWTAAVGSTQALFTLLDRISAWRDRVCAEQGFLSFTDVQYLLSPLRRAGEAGGLPGPGELREQMEYRLDGGIDHWLLDEFQDTSDLQWSILANLAGEVIMDTAGTRSFFIVGDLKQSIYRWRGGNPLLFDRVLAQFPDAFAQQSLHHSFRSAPAVLKLVNQVFALAHHPAWMPSDAVAVWTAGWREHACGSRKLMDKSGYAGWWTLPEKTEKAERPESGSEDEGGAEEEADERMEIAVAELVKQLDPAGRGLSVAVLTRSNAAAARLSHALRERCPGVPVHLEGRAALLDDAVVRLLLSLLVSSARPDDPIAAGHLRMSPLAAEVEAEPGPRRLAALQRDGVRRFLEDWIHRLARLVELPAFTRERLRQLVDLAARFDETEPPDPDLFARVAADEEIRSPAGTVGVRLMTVHTSKGLEFDAVILPGVNSRSGLTGGGAVEWLVQEDDEPWVLRPPHLDLAEEDPSAGPALMRERAQRCLEALCVLYVALTRAKRALYVITEPVKSTSKARNETMLLREHLRPGEKDPAAVRKVTGDCAVMWETGDAGCLLAEPLRPPHAAVTAVAAPDGPVTPWSEPATIRPSRVADAPKPVAAETMWDKPAEGGKRFGVAVHALFERLEWLDTTPAEETVAAWQAAQPEPAAALGVAQLVRRALAEPAVRARFTRPAGPHLLWRERPFDAAQPDGIAQGVMDRVVVHLGPDGAPVRAEILDFKTDRITPDRLAAQTAHHRPQMTLYRRSLARLLGIADTAVKVELLFTAIPAVADVFAEE